MNGIHTAIQQYLNENDYAKFALKTVIFDMDGVVYDSMPRHAAAWVAVMRNLGINMSEQDVYIHEGRIGTDTIACIAKREGLHLDLEERKKIYQEKTKMFAAGPPVPVMNGIVTFFQQITTQGLFAMLVTGSGQPTLIDRLNQDFPNVFARPRMVTAFDVTNGKPHPEAYLTALQREHLHPYEAIVIENAPLGVMAARAAGLFVIAVNTGALPDYQLFEAGANLLLPSLVALSEQWEQLYTCLL